ncbi:MAG: hypothetical protein CBC24_03220 [Candidatus Pelagibacter sp. TMED64]|nr:hypothetical protein [Candidatus Pelagibacter sp.]OUU66352.1 MAG: hypothetical protein CBC24_03220 [Candidatus Pelagibacter sp. TMED64]|tara:strand:- start:3836 stop:4633 length:798 start_codon:yes stop_codon:yes gene_type:complete
MISKKDILKYNNDGYLTIKNFFNKKEILNAKNEILKKVNSKNKLISTYYEDIKKKKEIRRIEKISDYSKYSKKLVISEKLKKILKILLKKKFFLFKDKVNFKQPGGAGFLPHIDGHFYWKNKKDGKQQEGWSKYGDSFINIVIPMDSTTKKNGYLFLSKKKYTFKKYGKRWKNIADNLVSGTPNLKDDDIKDFKFNGMVLNIGDILIFDWKCCHFSKKNLSKKSRMIFYLTYVNACKKNSNYLVRKKYYSEKKNSLNPLKRKSLQ